MKAINAKVEGSKLSMLTLFGGLVFLFFYLCQLI